MGKGPWFFADSLGLAFTSGDEGSSADLVFATLRPNPYETSCGAILRMIAEFVNISRGLQRLDTAWCDRLHVIRCTGVHLQGAITQSPLPVYLSLQNSDCLQVHEDGHVFIQGRLCPSCKGALLMRRAKIPAIGDKKMPKHVTLRGKRSRR